MSLSLGSLSAALECEDKFSKVFETFDDKSASVLKKLSAIEGAVGAIAFTEFADKVMEGFDRIEEAIAAPTEKLIEFGELIQNTSTRTGIATDELQVLKVAAEEAGAGFDSITSASARFQTKLGQGSAATIAAVQRLGLSMTQLRNEDPGEALVQTLQALDKIPNSMERAALGTALLGRGFMALLPVGATFDEIKEKMESLGMIIDSGVIAAAKRAGAEFGFLDDVVQNTIMNFGAGVVTSKAFHDAIQLLTVMVGQLSKWAQDNQAMLRSWADTGIQYAAYILAGMAAVIGGVFLPILHEMVNELIYVREGFALTSASIQLAIDLYNALGSHSLALAKQAFVDYGVAVSAANINAANSIAKYNGAFKTVDTAVSNTMNRFKAFGDEVGKTNGAVTDMGAAMKKNAPFGGPPPAGFAAIDAEVDKLSGKLGEMWGKVTTEGEMDAYSKKLDGVDQEVAKLTDTTDQLIAKAKKIGDNDAVAKLEIMKVGYAEWGDAMKDAAQKAEMLKEVDAVQQKLQASTDAYDKALYALNPTVQLQNKMIADQVALKDLEIDKWLKSNPLVAMASALTDDQRRAWEEANPELAQQVEQLAGAADKMHALNQETAALTAQKKGIDDFVGSLSGIGGALSKMGAGGVGGAISGAGGIFKDLTTGGGLSSIGSMFNSSDGTGDSGPTAGSSGVMELAKNFMGGLSKAMPIAAAAMGVFSAIGGLFAPKPEYQQIEDALGSSLGGKITDATAKAIASTESTDHVTRAIAELLNLSKMEADVGSFTSGIVADMGKLMSGIADKTVPAAKGMAELDSLFGTAQKDATTDIDAMTIALVEQAQKLGVVTPAMQKYIDAAKGMEAAGAGTIAGGFGQITSMSGLGLTPDQASSFGTDAATFFEAGFDAEMQTKGLVGALDAEKKNFDAMYAAMTKAGNAAGLALLQPQKQLMDAFEGSDTSLKGLVTTLEGEDQVFKGVAQQGLMTTDTFSAMERSIGTTDDALGKAGITGRTALLGIHGELQDVIDAHNAYGIPIDAATQKLIDQSKAAGLAFKEDPITQMTKAIEDLVKTLGGATTAFDDMGASAQNAANRMSTGGNGQRPGGANGQLPSYAKGSDGFKDFGAGTLTMLHGVEAVVTAGSMPPSVGAPSGYAAASGGGATLAALIEEVKGLRADVKSPRVATNQARAMRDAMVKTRRT